MSGSLREIVLDFHHFHHAALPPRPRRQAGGYTVLADPEGNRFCLVD